MSGQGGQGIITLGLIYGRAAALYGKKQVIMTEAYGPEITGGFAKVDLIIDDDPIDYPMVNSPDVLVVMSNEGWDMNSKYVKESGKIIYENFLVTPAENGKPLFGVPALKTAEELGRKVVANVIMLGALTEITKIIPREHVEKALLDRVPKGTEELNLSALRRGYELANAPVQTIGGVQ
jgi:2-oxoglutarate ferredoxin oxidoreductase subunit gamma